MYQTVALLLVMFAGCLAQPNLFADPRLLISEYRLSGLNGTNDEFVEIYNNSDSPHLVAAADGSAGYVLAKSGSGTGSNGVTCFVIPNGTIIPPRGHFLGVNASYSLNNYPAGSGTGTVGDITNVVGIENDAGIALFRTATRVNFVLSNRLDAVGSTAETNLLYKEGTGHGLVLGTTLNHSWCRSLSNGIPKNTTNNAVDFLFMDTAATLVAGAGQRLGVPGPENLSSPIYLPTGPSIARTLLDPAVSLMTPPNRVRDLTSDPANNSTLGTITLRRKFTNRTGNNVTRLRFRVVYVSTAPPPAGMADTRLRSIGNNTVNVGGGPALVYGTTLEQPPSQPMAGGFNASLSLTNVSPATPLTNGASINVRFLFGVQQTGESELAILVETIPASSSEIWRAGDFDCGGFPTESTSQPQILNIQQLSNDIKVLFTTSPGRLYQLQRVPNLATNAIWTNIGTLLSGTGSEIEATDIGGAGQARQFYRLRVEP